MTCGSVEMVDVAVVTARYVSMIQASPYVARSLNAVRKEWLLGFVGGEVTIRA